MAIHEPAAVDGQMVYRSYIFAAGPIRSIPEFLELQVRRFAEDVGILLTKARRTGRRGTRNTCFRRR